MSRKATRSLALRLALMALGSFAFGFALVPLYDVMCEVTGYGNRKRAQRSASAPSKRRTSSARVTVEFVANLPSRGSFEFRPAVHFDAGASRQAVRDHVLSRATSPAATP